MSKNDETKDAPAVVSAPAVEQPDPHWGCGGSYIRDPVTGQRTLVQRTEGCQDCQGKKG